MGTAASRPLRIHLDCDCLTRAPGNPYRVGRTRVRWHAWPGRSHEAPGVRARFIDSQFLLGASSRDPGLLQREIDRAAGLLEDLGIRGDAPPALPRGPDSHASAGTPPDWAAPAQAAGGPAALAADGGAPDPRARGGVLLSAHDGSGTARRNALDHAIALLELAERLDSEPPSAPLPTAPATTPHGARPSWPAATATAPPGLLRPTAAT